MTGAGLNESEEFLTGHRRGGNNASADFNINVGYDVDSSGSAQRLANYGEPKKTNSPDDAQTLAETRYSKYAHSSGKGALPADPETARGSQGGAALLNEEARKKNKHRFNAKLKMFDHDPQVEAQKKDALNQRKRNHGYDVHDEQQDKPQIVSFFGFDYKYESDTDDEEKYATKANKRFPKLKRR